MMTYNRLLKLAVTAAFAALPVTAASADTNLVTNGNFANGLSAWTTYTVNGSAGTPIATTFDVTGDGIDDTTSRLEVFSANNMPGGGGLLQQFTLTSSTTVSFAAAIAASRSSGVPNLDAGTLSAIIDGITYASNPFGNIGGVETLRSNLAFTTLLGAGTHELRLQATRAFTQSGTPLYQYFTNVSLNTPTIGAPAVPEPTSWGMMLIGFGGMGFAMRRRTRIISRAHFA